MVSLAEGFGLNTDILDTNVLNLIFVIGVLATSGREALNGLLTARRQRVLVALQGADERYKEAQAELEVAVAEYKMAVDKVVQIELEGGEKMVAIYNEEAAALAAVEAEHEALKEEACRLEEEKMKVWFRNMLINKAFDKVAERVKVRMTPQLHKKYIDAKIELMNRTL